MGVVGGLQLECRLFEGGDSNTKKVADYSRVATIRGRRLFEGGDSNTKTWENVADYSRAATSSAGSLDSSAAHLHGKSKTSTRQGSRGHIPCAAARHAAARPIASRTNQLQ